MLHGSVAPHAQLLVTARYTTTANENGYSRGASPAGLQHSLNFQPTRSSKAMR